MDYLDVGVRLTTESNDQMTRPTVDEMRDKMLRIMVGVLDDINAGLQFTVEHKLKGVRQWIALMKTMASPEDIDKSFGDIIRSLEDVEKTRR